MHPATGPFESGSYVFRDGSALSGIEGLDRWGRGEAAYVRFSFRCNLCGTTVPVRADRLYRWFDSMEFHDMPGRVVTLADLMEYLEGHGDA